METLVGALMIVAPFAATAWLLALANRRQRRRLAEIDRQIALTDAIHARLGAVVAPEVRRRGGRWQIAIAAPLERPSVVASVLSTVEAAFREPGGAPYEVVLRPQATPGSRSGARRPVAVRRASLSWT